MEFLLREALLSRQGKATSHRFPTLHLAPQRRKKHREPVLSSFASIRALANEVVKQSKEHIHSLEPAYFTASFRTVSRDNYHFAFRNRTNSPKVGRYRPKTEIISPRVLKVPIYTPFLVEPKQKKIFLPGCLDSDLNCTHPAPVQRPPNNTIKRKIQLLEIFERRVQERMNEAPSLQPPRTAGLIEFDKMPRKKPLCGPVGPQRFDCEYPTSNVHSKHRKALSMSFAKRTDRGELFPVGPHLDSYDRNEEAVLPKLSTLVLSFDKMCGRN